MGLCVSERQTGWEQDWKSWKPENKWGSGWDVKHEIGSSGIPFWMFWCLHFDWKEIAAVLGASFDFLCSCFPGLEAGAHFDLGRRMEGRPAHGREKEGEPSLKPSVLDSPAQNQGKSKRHV